MKKTLLLLFLPIWGLLAQESHSLKLKPPNFHEVAREVFYSDSFEWTNGNYAFLGISAYSFAKNPFELDIRFKTKDGWQEWQAMDDQHNEEDIQDRQTFVLNPFEEQILAWEIHSSDLPQSDLVMRFFTAPKENNQDLQLDFSSISDPESCSCPRPPVCDRNCWCPDGTCPPPTYDNTTPTHLIVHHSAGFTNATDYQYVVAYYWDLHVNTNGWSDIGYNWLIDPNGVVYEGRGSGHSGAHFSCMNSGTLGFCVIGDYRTNPVQSAALQSLAEILLYEGCQNSINLADSSVHTSSQLMLRHISGHRDGNSASVGCPKGTVCPGQVLYDKLDSLALALSQNACMLSQKDYTIDQSLKLFPNPATEILHWEGDGLWTQPEIRDLSGRSVLIQNINENSLDVSDLAAGIYFLSLQHEGHRQTFKFWIQ